MLRDEQVQLGDVEPGEVVAAEHLHDEAQLHVLRPGQRPQQRHLGLVLAVLGAKFEFNLNFV